MQELPLLLLSRSAVAFANPITAPAAPMVLIVLSSGIDSGHVHLPAKLSSVVEYGLPTASTLTSSPEKNLSCCFHRPSFSVHGNSITSSFPNLLFNMQVCKPLPLFARKSDDTFLLVFPCQQMLCEIVLDCFSVALLLLRSGDIKTNPGPTTPSENLLDIESLPENPTEQMPVLFKLIKDIHTRSLQSAEVQNELAADIKSIKYGQKNIEAKIIAVQKRLDDLEQKSEVFEKVNEELAI